MVGAAALGGGRDRGFASGELRYDIHRSEAVQARVDAMSAQASAALATDLMAAGCGDRAAFRRVYAATQAKLFGICLRICGDRSGAEDVLAEVYLTIWQRAAGWVPGRASPVAWVATIARNRAIDWRRAHPAARNLPLEAAGEIVDRAPDAEMLLMCADDGRQLRDMLGTLDPRQRAAIGGAFFDGLTYAETARRDGVPLGTVKSRIRRGLARLKAGLGDR